ncbi:MAG: hypothetical protein IPK13_19790 [Deltaproteobacteria bacterium]|nr:hypothetical protein [Deltaproteobacteria bacterium]
MHPHDLDPTRARALSPLVLALLVAGVGCTKSAGSAQATERQDAAVASVDGEASDASVNADADAVAAVDAEADDGGAPDAFDAGPPDSGPPPCRHDQGGRWAYGCPEGEVCNVQTGECGPGEPCSTDQSCDKCSDFVSPADCGHGFHLTAWCDPEHGGTCTRSRAPCEPCEEDTDCGRMHPDFGGTQIRCVTYPDAKRYCATPSRLGCPDGFVANAEGLCMRSEGCADEPIVCPAATPAQNCPGNDQICPGAACPDIEGAFCTTNDQPGILGLCMGACQTDADCPDDLPTCNPKNGLCIAGCTKDSCPAGRVCHLDGFCALPCASNEDCTANPRYGDGTYCNRPNQPPPRIFKGHRDENACAPLGCEIPEDCPAPGLVCDATRAPPACVEGCYAADDCLAGEVCRQGTPGEYSRAECRALPEKTDESAVGACCNPGCTNRVLQCGLHEFCCGEVDSPYEDPSACLDVSAGVQAQPGECFPMATPPWCQRCTGAMPEEGQPPECNSGWTAGYNVDPAINGGQPFQEQEFCYGIAEEVGVCSVTCNPEASDSNHQCPRGWICAPTFLPCTTDDDCGGLSCVGADPENGVAGRCRCGEGGVPSQTCPDTYPAFPVAIEHPRCLPGPQAQMFCGSGFNCAPPGNIASYPATCELQ